MLRFVVTSLALAIALAVLGFGGAAGAFAGVAKVLSLAILLFTGVTFGLAFMASRTPQEAYN